VIVVRVELHSAQTKEITPLHTIVIDNVGVYDEGRKADYRARTWKRGVELLDIRLNSDLRDSPIREGLVDRHPRKSKPVLNLVYKALVALGYNQ